MLLISRLSSTKKTTLKSSIGISSTKAAFSFYHCYGNLISSSTTMNSMQSKIEGLATTNALMKEDLSICKAALVKSQEENKKLKAQLELTSESGEKVIRA